MNVYGSIWSTEWSGLVCLEMEKMEKREKMEKMEHR
jgi:hypothetical protein